MSTPAGSGNGKSGSDTAEVKDHLRAAGEAAASAARARAGQARDWAQDKWSGLQERVEAKPYQATAWALGIGIAAGFLIGTFLRPRR
jgi:ElaB/YqjD/DUF883 family membrane-anchored ribosome-binding protein